MFSHHEAGIPAIRQLKIIEKGKKLVDKMKNLYKCNFNQTSSTKANKTIEHYKEKSLSLHCSLFREVCGTAARDQATTLYGLPIPQRFAWVKSQAIPPEILNKILIYLQNF